ncbi:ParB/RepB/Spo0J family partition protein [Chlorogloea sp. CCALA 695]|uniref:ParB/RepB/Spo0J family partition protein n=1 Tax=Chlorogloea sp. CCALA 695 TaxID=2107693 RepID=UPI000D0586FB|nr:ParB/RepB/Spo0J family partition protein [Chlorogloea sp. CCALA 695]PSB31325.1 chromosome partitioning protein ParB [Chlorogloea sp. CCALA 695]
MTKKQLSVPQMRGVSAFLSPPVSEDESGQEPLSNTISTVSISQIHLPQNQPRRYFDSEKLQQLAASIKQHGILEPLLVRPFKKGEYELVAGERRYRAAKEVGLQEIPITVRELSDQEALQLALVENLQREDLNPIEETEGVLDLLKLMMSCGTDSILDTLTQMATAQKKGIETSGNVSRQIETITTILESTIGITPESFRTSRLPLLNLPSDILDAIRQGKLEYTKARIIARIKDSDKRQSILKEAIAQKLSLNQIRERIKATCSPTSVETLTLKQRMQNISRRFQNTKSLDNSKKQEQIEKLVAKLEFLLTEDK